ncbi:predicted protein [Sclerotinia sclerotiorum 1980 UF-70]|uniref:Uncharacterized protein n=2 Tax=Sclerotinia sclerotiorum (strain ATCC 18683 / 1980 / Ss-1) TaxID=665079 RepID=A7ERS6_SCLS1|nr:predicted protein [Sclerotinia sclerotiorum 1980 UF-70]APA13379.1 hypothetical protein sscle_11g081490 [Sclerotinia sclerotiorum 1980 UF-70]EDN92168.1 predicted protein [Sclerotinia sclerotiorum 1980 UF-70]
MENTKEMEDDLHKFTAYVSSFHQSYGEDNDQLHLDLSKHIIWSKEVVKCISWYMHTYDQYQVPAKMRKRSRNSIVFDVANFLLSKTACRARPWVVGYVRKRCHSLMKDLVITWHAQRYLTKTQNVFRKSFMFKECWERARERLHRGSDKSNTLDNEEPLTKRQAGNLGPVDGKYQKVRRSLAADHTIAVKTFDLDLVEDLKSLSGTEAEIHIPHPITANKSMKIGPEPQRSTSQQRNPFPIPSKKNGSVVDVTSGNEWRVDMKDALDRPPRNVVSGDEPSPHSTTTIAPRISQTPIIYPALPQTPPSQLILDESPSRVAQASRDANTESPPCIEIHDIISHTEKIAALPIESIMGNRTIFERFGAIATIITPERGFWVGMPAGPVLDDFNFHSWYSREFGLDEIQGLRFHYMDSWLNPLSCPVDVGRSELENTKLKQHLFFDFVETYNHFKGNLRTYRILIIPENMVRLSVSCQKYPSYNKEKLFEFYHDCDQQLRLFSGTKSLNSQIKAVSGSQMYYKKGKRLESSSLLNVMGPPNSSSAESATSRIRGTEPSIQLPSLLPPINLPLRKLPSLGEMDIGRFVNHPQPAGEPEIVIRVQKPDGKFTGPLRKAPFGPGVTTQEFFTWFMRVSSQPAIAIPNILQFCFKDAIPAIEYKICRGDERQFTQMKRNILPQCRHTVAMMSSVSEFAIIIRELHRHAGLS